MHALHHAINSNVNKFRIIPIVVMKNYIHMKFSDSKIKPISYTTILNSGTS